MANVARHSSTHRFAFVGGTDPLNVELPGAYALETSDISITADGEFEWAAITTNNDQCFRWDNSDPAGILIQSDGYYVAMVNVDVGSTHKAVDRSFLLKTGTVGGGSGGDFGVDNFYAGRTTVNSASTLPSEQEEAEHLWFIGLQGYFNVDPEDPIRVALLFNHMGSNFTNITTNVYLFRVATLDGFGAPMKYEPT